MRSAVPRGIAVAFLLAFALLTVQADAAPVCAQREALAPALKRLEAAMGQGRFISYAPTALVVREGHASHADAASIRADLAALRPRFDSLITYGALNGTEAVPDIARSLGFRALIVGIWNPFDEREVAAALAAASRYPDLVVGLAAGNETVFARRRSAADLGAQLEKLHARAPTVPIATTEPFHVFYTSPGRDLLGDVDFLLANVHPVFQPWFRNAPDANAAAFVVGVVDELAKAYCGPILVKETGVPTAPAAAGFSAARQAGFYRALRLAFPPQPTRAFAYFSAFDAPWRVADEQAAPGVHPEEAYWGLFDAARAPKPALLEVPLLPPIAAE